MRPLIRLLSKITGKRAYAQEPFHNLKLLLLQSSSEEFKSLILSCRYSSSPSAELGSNEAMFLL